MGLGAGGAFIASTRRQTLILHMASNQWIEGPAPKITGPHESYSVNRELVDSGGRLYQVALGKDSNLYQEGRGAYNQLFDLDNPISSVVETGWIYPNGPQNEALIKTISWYHGKWAANAVVDLLTYARRDRTKITQTHLRTCRPTSSKVDWFWAFKGGQAFKFELRHIGANNSLSSSTFGPIQLEVADMGGIQEE